MKRLGEGRNLDRVRVKGDHIPWGLVQLAHVRLQRNRTTLYAGRRRRGRQGRGEQKRGKLGVLADPHDKDKPFLLLPPNGWVEMGFYM